MITKEEIFENLGERNKKYSNVKGLINSFASNNEDKIKQFRLLARMANDDLNRIKNFVYNKNTNLEDVKELSPYISAVELEREKYFNELTNLGYQVKEVGKCVYCQAKFYNAIFIAETEEQIKDIRYCADSCEENFKEKKQLQVDVEKNKNEKELFLSILGIVSLLLFLIIHYLSFNSYQKKTGLDLKNLKKDYLTKNKI